MRSITSSAQVAAGDESAAPREAATPPVQIGQAAWLDRQLIANDGVLATFGPGPLGFTIAKHGEVGRVADVNGGSQASAQGVEPGDVILEVDGCSIEGLDQTEVLNAIKQAERPMTILFRPAQASAIERAQSLRT